MIVGHIPLGNAPTRSLRSRLQELSQTKAAEFIVEPLFVERQSLVGNGQAAAGDAVQDPYRTRHYEAAVSDIELESKDWVSNVVGLCTGTTCTNAAESADYDILSHSKQHDHDTYGDMLEDPRTALSFEHQLRREDSLSSHLGLQALILPCPFGSNVNFARILLSMCEALPANSYKQYWIYFTLDLTGKNDGWKHWDSLRFLINHNPKVGIALQVINPSFACRRETASKIVERWAAEPVKALCFGDRAFEPLTDIFDSSMILVEEPLPFQNTQLEPLFRLQKIHVIHSPLEHRPIGHGGAKDQWCSTDNRKHLLKEHYSECIAQGAMTDMKVYRDTLQEPLQPLADNLENSTYEVFESDPVKYERYESAILKAMCKIKTGKNTIDYNTEELKNNRMSQMNVPLSGGHAVSRKRKLEEDEDEDTSGKGNGVAVKAEQLVSVPVQVAVVGAGRGPLVACTLRAAAVAGIHIHIQCVEKNANAIITLRNRHKLEAHWEDVEIFENDMRSWKPSCAVDILVSELLGSWGDNELSPECLDGVLHCLSPTGVSIPQSYDSYIAPISCAKLWMCSRDVLQGRGLDTPYVVNLHSCYYLAPSQKVFTFTHDVKDINGICSDNSHNRRYQRIKFKSEDDATIHGLAGTFESVLFDDVKLSIRPETINEYSKNMFSWFPMFIPFGTPVRVKKGEIIEVAMWRCTRGHKVWYEWCLTSPECLPMQNSNGRSSWIGL